MQITVKAKQAGRKHALIENKTIEIEDVGNEPSLADLLDAVVKQQIEEYTAKPAEKNLLPFLAEDEIAQKTESGKVGFGSVYNENKVDLAKAQETARQAFADGMFSVFADDEEIKSLGDKVFLSDNTIVTFIRLTFLAGSYW